jgi:D-inositol-3-phosphate glycosyltransferase
LSQFRALYGQSPGVVNVASPGVATAFFSPGDRQGARRALKWGNKPLLLFVGRIQPLKGVDVAVQTLAKLENQDAELMVVGGASGSFGSSESSHVRKLISDLGLTGRVHFVEPLFIVQPTLSWCLLVARVLVWSRLKQQPAEYQS